MNNKNTQKTNYGKSYNDWELVARQRNMWKLEYLYKQAHISSYYLSEGTQNNNAGDTKKSV